MTILTQSSKLELQFTMHFLKSLFMNFVQPIQLLFAKVKVTNVLVPALTSKQKI